ncbi:GDSL esterase/lipase At1g71691 [Gossypium hirsutum]|uniref:GDSL esterase/lipase At1g71691 n=1 Tax=Gossypium hirsutum TaxID=3635 RepID=A0ABM2ZQJ9_GOSHI|nr:GDSL esterase/lipase At1g71691-like [Gossypium hirsutum]
MGPATNGRTVVDFIPQVAGLPFPPPILRLSKAQRKTTPTGVNHGSASSGKQPSPPPAIKIFTIYKLGARKFLLDNNVSPLGCVPANIHAKKHNTSCVEDINQRVAFFNGLLPNVLTKLEKILTGSTLVGCDLYKLFEDVCNQPASYGALFCYGFL